MQLEDGHERETYRNLKRSRIRTVLPRVVRTLYSFSIAVIIGKEATAIGRDVGQRPSIVLAADFRVERNARADVGMRGDMAEPEKSTSGAQ